MTPILDAECSYDGIADFYEKWCSGDEAYQQSFDFYTAFLQTQPGPFLELGIGTGRIALDLISRIDCQVVGIDTSKKMLDRCHKDYLELQRNGKAVGILFLVHDCMENLKAERKFQTVYLPFRTVGHILSDITLRKLFESVYRSLLPGGLFLLDHYIFHRFWAEAHDAVDIPMFEDADEVITDYYRYDFSNGRMDCSVKRNGILAQTFRFRWIEVETIRKLAELSGFTVEKLYGDFDGSAWNADSPNQIWVFRK